MNANIEKMIELVSKKLGIPQEKLKASLEKGNIDELIMMMVRGEE